jgi:hypothetical protein
MAAITPHAPALEGSLADDWGSPKKGTFFFFGSRSMRRAPRYDEKEECPLFRIEVAVSLVNGPSGQARG